MITRCLVYPGLGLGRDWLTSRQLYKVEHIRVYIYLVLQSIYYRRPAGEKRREAHTKPSGEEVGSPRVPGLHRNISIGFRREPPNTVTQISQLRVREYLQQPPLRSAR